MKQSQLFTKTRKEAPTDEVAKNAQLLIRAGFLHKEAAGIYSYLPLGLRVLRKIETIIRNEMNSAGGVEVLLPALHPREYWEKTGRWDTMDDLYKVSDASGREMALGATHEEVVSPLMKEYIGSYRDLPIYVYQIQNKFRMELRSKSGILRGREFVMKDLYSFHTDEKDLDIYYEKMQASYKNIFEKVGLGDKTYLTFASGGSFSKFSHEFQTLTSAGEDIIYICDKCHIAINEEIIEEQKTCPSCGGTELVKDKAVEVANIFKLLTKYSEPFSLTYKDEQGKEQPVIMGCYGLGLGRILGTVVEVLSDENGLVWPKSIAPFGVHIVTLGQDEKVIEKAEKLYNDLVSDGVEVLYDDRDIRAGEKFADSDLIGIPARIVLSSKNIETDGFEVKERTQDSAATLSYEELLKIVL